jgi:hypothetical protein
VVRPADPSAAESLLSFDRHKSGASFSADLPAKQAAFMADSQVPWGVDALGGQVSELAWPTRPSWYLVATEDRTILPSAQRAMPERAGATVSEAAGSHSIYVFATHRSRVATRRSRCSDPAGGAELNATSDRWSFQSSLPRFRRLLGVLDASRAVLRFSVTTLPKVASDHRPSRIRGRRPTRVTRNTRTTKAEQTRQAHEGQVPLGLENPL